MIAYTQGTNWQQALALCGAAVVLVEILIGAFWAWRRLRLPGGNRVLGTWINLQGDGDRVGIFAIRMKYTSFRPNIVGRVYDLDGNQISSWRSAHVEILNDGRDLYYLYSGGPYGAQAGESVRTTFGLAYMSFAQSEGAYRSAAGHFVDDHSLRMESGHGSVRELVSTKSFRVDRSLFRALDLPALKISNESSVRVLVERLAERKHQLLRSGLHGR